MERRWVSVWDDAVSIAVKDVLQALSLPPVPFAESIRYFSTREAIATLRSHQLARSGALRTPDQTARRSVPRASDLNKRRKKQEGKRPEPRNSIREAGVRYFFANQSSEKVGSGSWPHSLQTTAWRDNMPIDNDPFNSLGAFSSVRADT
jgi:hypothetical protein